MPRRRLLQELTQGSRRLELFAGGGCLARRVGQGGRRRHELAGEALVDGVPVGTGTVVDGEARLTVALDVEHRGPTTLSVRYLPSSPFYKPGPMLEVTVPVAPPSIMLRVVLAGHSACA